MNFQELEVKVKHLIATDDIGMAIQLLSIHFNNNDRLDEIILQSGRYHALEKDLRLGILDYAEVQKILNQLRANILTFLRLEKEEIKLSTLGDTDESPVNIELQVRLSVARVSILLLLKKEDTNAGGLTISQIYRLSKIKSRKNIFESLQEMVKANIINKEKVGRTTYWKLSEKGTLLAQEIEMTLLLNVNTK